jgi:hypothetical protein
MKKLLLSVAICLVISPAAASLFNREDCPSTGQLAGSFMEVRQKGWSVTRTLSFVSTEYVPEVKEYFENVVLRAYRQPRWNTEEMINKSIENFRNEVELECYTG